MSTQQPYGEAAGYYNNNNNNNNPEPANPRGYSQHLQQQRYAVPPLQYSEKPMFDQAFKLERPKYNDLWAGILFLLVCAGFVAVSGLAIHGYGKYAHQFPYLGSTPHNWDFTGHRRGPLILQRTDSRVASEKGTYGNGIYDSNSRAGLNTNTIVLFAFVLTVAVVLSYSYVLLARTFPRAFIWVTGMHTFCSTLLGIVQC